MTVPEQLTVIVPVKELDASALARLERMAAEAPDLEVIAVGKACGRRDREVANLRILDRECSIYDAMNEGSQAARSDFLLFMGIDDHLLAQNVPQVLRQLASAAGSDLVVLPFKVGTRQVQQQPTTGRMSSFHHQGVLFRRAGLIDAGGYDRQYTLHSDLDLMFRMQRTGRVSGIDIPLVQFSKGGMTTSGKHAYTSIRQFNAIYAAHGVSRTSFQFLFSVALLLLYRARFLWREVSRIPRGSRFRAQSSE